MPAGHPAQQVQRISNGGCGGKAPVGVLVRLDPPVPLAFLGQCGRVLGGVRMSKSPVIGGPCMF